MLRRNSLASLRNVGHVFRQDGGDGIGKRIGFEALSGDGEAPLEESSADGFREETGAQPGWRGYSLSTCATG
jgi:hypothetical protein